MKKIILLAIIGFVLLLGACAETEATSTNESEESGRFTVRDERITITEDTVTGCKYIIYDRTSATVGGGGFTPLMKADGTQDCD